MIHLRNDDDVLELAAKIRAERTAQDYAEKSTGAMLKGSPGIEVPRIGLSNEDIVSHHSPDREQIQRISTIRAAARNFLDAIDTNCPRCADATAAKRKVREAMMTANAAIVLNGSI